MSCSNRLAGGHESVVVEIKSATAIEPVHVAQVLTCMGLGNRATGLLINFNVDVLRHGIRHLVP